MRRNYPKNPQLQPVKGVFVFNRKEEDYIQKALELLKSMHCQILASQDNRITVSTSRGNLQNIKQSWLAKNIEDDLSARLNKQVTQIIIGGNVN